MQLWQRYMCIYSAKIALKGDSIHSVAQKSDLKVEGQLSPFIRQIMGEWYTLSF